MTEPVRGVVRVGVGAVVVGRDGRLFLARRGPAARNERDAWEFPGGAVRFGETLTDAVRRELAEEYGMTVTVVAQLGAADHILPDEHQHWVSVSYVADHAGGEPAIREPGKCTAIGWFDAAQLPAPLSAASEDTLAAYLAWRR